MQICESASLKCDVRVSDVQWGHDKGQLLLLVPYAGAVQRRYLDESLQSKRRMVRDGHAEKGFFFLKFELVTEYV